MTKIFCGKLDVRQIDWGFTMTKKFFIATLTAASLMFGTASAMKPVTLIEQGSFMAGVYDGSDPRNFASENNTFRIGEYPDYYANAKVLRDAESLRQFFHQMMPSFPTEQKIIVVPATEETTSLFLAVVGAHG